MFEPNVNESELVWHRDKQDRKVSVVKGKGWKFQMDNDLPIEITKGLKLFIPEGEYHRILKGTGDLKVRVRKLNKTRLLPHTPKVK